MCLRSRWPNFPLTLDWLKPLSVSRRVGLTIVENSNGIAELAAMEPHHKAYLLISRKGVLKSQREH